MSLQRLLLPLCLLCACDSLAAAGGDASTVHRQPEPLPADLIAACPDAARFDRASHNECTDVGCSSGFNLNVSPSSGWAPGMYTFELTIDGRRAKCEGSVPLKDCTTRSFSCDADGVRLGESGCALPENAQGIASIMFDGFPLDLSIRVSKDGQELTSTKLTPSYRTGQPNGPGCEPVCCSASGELNVPTGS